MPSGSTISGLVHESASAGARYLLRNLRKFILLVVPIAADLPSIGGDDQSIPAQS